MNYGIVKPVLIAFFISVLLSPMMIRYLHKLKFGQFIRGEGPESHLKKSGTPTMGGLIILLGIVIASLFYVRRYPMIIPVLFVTLGFGFIGFIDDYIKVAAVEDRLAAVAQRAGREPRSGCPWTTPTARSVKN